MSGHHHLGDLLDDSVPEPPLALRAAPLGEIHRRARQRRAVARLVGGVVAVLVVAGLVLAAASLRG